MPSPRNSGKGLIYSCVERYNSNGDSLPLLNGPQSLGRAL